jgi:hypothetical protein
MPCPHCAVMGTAEQAKRTAVLAPVAIRPGFLAVLGYECRSAGADGDGSQRSSLVAAAPGQSSPRTPRHNPTGPERLGLA